MNLPIFAALALLTPVSLAGEVHVVDASAGPGSQYTDIQDAVDAASDGDTVLVRTGGYDSFFVTGIGLVITADTGELVSASRITIRDLAAEQSVRMRGIGTYDLNNGPGLKVSHCDGPVWIEDCDIGGPMQALGAADGAVVEDCAAVSFHRSTLRADSAIYRHAGAGLRASNSLVALYDCELIGGPGNWSKSGSALLAGPGATVDGGQLYASGSSFKGGQGAGGSFLGTCLDAADGATGLVLTGGVDALSSDTQTIGGEGGIAFTGCEDGAAGPSSEVLAGTLVEQVFPARSLAARSPVRSGELLSLSIAGEPGDAAFLAISLGQTSIHVSPAASLAGGVWLADPTTAVVLPLGTLTTGSAQIQFHVPELALQALEFTFQGLFAAPLGEAVFSSGQGVTVLTESGQDPTPIRGS